MESLQELDKKKKEIETEAEQLFQYLNQDGMPGLHGKLIDDEGFPRSDIDIYAIREARHKIACLKTDYKQLSQEIENALHELHSKSRIAIPRSSPSSTQNIKEVEPIAFGIIDQVFIGSPAESAGLKSGDALITFGSISLKELSNISECFEKLMQIVKEDSLLELRVFRDGQYIDVTLHPHRWTGNGLLGCHIKPNTI